MESMRIFCELLSAIDFCHRQGFAHRDIKPGGVRGGVEASQPVAGPSRVTQQPGGVRGGVEASQPVAGPSRVTQQPGGVKTTSGEKREEPMAGPSSTVSKQQPVRTKDRALAELIAKHEMEELKDRQLKCSNCGESETPAWRKGRHKALLCNKCGLHWKRYRKDRPLAYFIGVVWSCYKYLMLRVYPGQRTIHYIDTESLLPSYEAAVKKYPTPPPSYDTATRNNPPPPPAPAPISAPAPTPVPAPEPAPASNPTIN